MLLAPRRTSTTPAGVCAKPSCRRSTANDEDSLVVDLELPNLVAARVFDVAERLVDVLGLLARVRDADDAAVR